VAFQRSRSVLFRNANDDYLRCSKRPDRLADGHSRQHRYPAACQMVGSEWLPSGAAPPSTTDSRLWFPLNKDKLRSSPGNDARLGQYSADLTYGPGFENLDLSIAKAFVIREARRSSSVRRL